jgi:hypothetical protein
MSAIHPATGERIIRVPEFTDVNVAIIGLDACKMTAR